MPRAQVRALVGKLRSHKLCHKATPPPEWSSFSSISVCIRTEAESGDSRSYRTGHEINHISHKILTQQCFKTSLLPWMPHSCGAPVNWDLTVDIPNDSEIKLMSNESFLPTFPSVLALSQSNTPLLAFIKPEDK